MRRYIHSIVFVVVTLFPLISVGEETDLRKMSETIQALIFAEKFTEAEPLVHQCLQYAPEDLYFLSQFDLVLNGQHKYQEADELRNRIRTIWETHYKASWIAEGSPVWKGSWDRMLVPGK